MVDFITFIRKIKIKNNIPCTALNFLLLLGKVTFGLTRNYFCYVIKTKKETNLHLCPENNNLMFYVK